MALVEVVVVVVVLDVAFDSVLGFYVVGIDGLVVYVAYVLFVACDLLFGFIVVCCGL